ncbi:MAG: tetratricopeptide repeat protein, partial [Bacteroidales bacterium]|nr:tetratricopeptide repeat protein [Bacteroidales bacterium]
VPDSLEIPLHKADAWHNLGNMNLDQKEYAASIEAYKQSLRIRPEDVETKTNLAYAQKMLKDQQEQQEQQEQKDQNQDQDQDQDQNQNQDQNQDQDQKQDQGAQPNISPQAAQQMLEAVQQKEKETQEKVQKEKAGTAVPVRSGKNW